MILTTGPFCLTKQGLIRYPVLSENQEADVVIIAAEIIRDALTGKQHRYAGTFGFDRIIK